MISLNVENGEIYKTCDTVCSETTMNHKDTIVTMTNTQQSDRKTVSTHVDISMKDKLNLL